MKKIMIKNRKPNNKGIAMIVAVIIITILIVFTFSLTLIAYTLYASQAKNIANMRCAEAANTLSRAISDELTYTDSSKNRFPEYDSYLYKYLRYNLCQDSTWPYYISDSKENRGKHDRKTAVRYFDLKYNSSNPDAADGVDGLPGKTEVAIYWKLPEDSGVDKPSELTSRTGIRLVVEVTCESASESYTAVNEYILKTSTYSAKEGNRQSYLDSAGSNTSINPCGFTNINSTEKWVWVPASSE